jgi:polyisoprenoid-binding protein YceI
MRAIDFSSVERSRDRPYGARMPNYAIDTSHSEVSFTVRHMMFAKVRGQFKTWNATLSFDAADASKSSVQAEVDVASIDTRDEKRDGHLKSDDFFSADKFPKLAFKSKRIERAGKGYKLTGDLTIRDVTREITLDVEQTGSGKDPWGNQRLGFTATGSLNRTDYGLKWNQALETGGVLVGEHIDIEIDVEAIAKP